MQLCLSGDGGGGGQKQSFFTSSLFSLLPSSSSQRREKGQGKGREARVERPIHQLSQRPPSFFPSWLESPKVFLPSLPILGRRGKGGRNFPLKGIRKLLRKLSSNFSFLLSSAAAAAAAAEREEKSEGLGWKGEPARGRGMIPLPREKEMEGGIAPPASSCWNAWRSLAGATFVRLQRRCRRRPPPPLPQNFPFSPPFFFGRPPPPTPGKKLSSAGEEAAKNQLLSLSLSPSPPPGEAASARERRERGAVECCYTRACRKGRYSSLHFYIFSLSLIQANLRHLILWLRPPYGKKGMQAEACLGFNFFPRVCSLKNCRASRARKRGGGR